MSILFDGMVERKIRAETSMHVVCPTTNVEHFVDVDICLF